ncbi:MAG: arylsulfatase, partial [Anaerolineae bacterium]
GQTPRSHGRVGYRDGVPWNYPVTMAGEFTRHGYQTEAVGKMHVYPERSLMGFQHVTLHDGFLHFARSRHANLDEIDDYVPWLREQLGRDADYFEHGVNCNSMVVRPWDKQEYLHPTNWVTSQAIRFLERRDRRKPFFLFVSYHRPHPPLDPPAWAYEMYTHQNMPDPPIGDWHRIFAESSGPHRADPLYAQLDPRALQMARAAYYGQITHIDHQINRLLESLPENGVGDNTYICFTADHGEMLGDHHLFRKAYPYEGSARVPLLLAGPRDSGIVPNSVSHQVVELRDIMPTLLTAAGLPVPSTVEGKSLLPLARGEDVPWRPYLHGEHTAINQSMQWLTDGHIKYVWFSGNGQEQLFDLVSDPQETTNLATRADMQRQLEHWRRILMSELAGREEGFTDGERLITGRPVDPCLSHVRA